MEAFLSKRSPIPKSRKIIEEIAKVPRPFKSDKTYGLIGTGGCAEIHLYTHNGEVVAKKGPNGYNYADRMIRSTIIEIEGTMLEEAKKRAGERTVQLIKVVNNQWTELLIKLIEWQNLDEFLKNRQLENPQKAALAIECAQAIAELHRSGIIHRDIKESNLFMGHKIIIGDFGTAKIEGTEDLVRKIYGSHPVGSPSHLAPEFQVMRDPSVTADIYAFGVILHRILSGESLIDENKSSQEAFGWHRHGKLGNRDLVGWKIVQACLEKDPKKRPGSMESVRDGIGEEFERAKIKIPEFCSE